MELSGSKIAVVGLVIAGLCWTIWQKHNERALTESIRRMTDEYGFISLAPPDGGRIDEVLIAAAVDCPKEASVRADRLAAELGVHGVPVRRVAFFVFTATPDADQEAFVRVHNRIMSQDPPMVFVNGKVKSDPGLDEVLTEYKMIAVK